MTHLIMLKMKNGSLHSVPLSNVMMWLSPFVIVYKRGEHIRFTIVNARCQHIRACLWSFHFTENCMFWILRQEVFPCFKKIKIKKAAAWNIYSAKITISFIALQHEILKRLLYNAHPCFECCQRKSLLLKYHIIKAIAFMLKLWCAIHFTTIIISIDLQIRVKSNFNRTEHFEKAANFLNKIILLTIQNEFHWNVHTLQRWSGKQSKLN